MIEAQHLIATRKLVDSDREQEILEDLLESAKPPVAEGAGLHYLLFTAFRYPPLPHGSRFGSRWEPGIWYGSDALQTAFAEVAYYRFLFLEGTDADLDAIETDLSAFRAAVATARGVDLTAAPFEAWRRQLASKTSYAATQPLGAAMREAGVEACRYASARDAEGGTNTALFSPRAFAARRPRALQTWHSVTTRASVEFSKRDYFERRHYRFARNAFLVGGVLPHPAIEA
ncbi:MAG: RES family NAD+ phosphorylase [Betaproteobacteria bacterium]